MSIRVAEISGGVGGARMAAGFQAVPDVDFSVIVNVGDDETIHGLHVSPDLDTVVYTLASSEGPEGWGRAKETFVVNDELARFGLDNTFRLGDLDLALNLFRTQALGSGRALSDITRDVTAGFGLDTKVIPVTDDRVRTMVHTSEGTLGFQEYFVMRQAKDVVTSLTYEGARDAVPAPGVVEALTGADIVVVGPSNPPLSIWPMIAIPAVREALAEHPNVIAVSPLISGKAIKGPAAQVMKSLGLPSGTQGVLKAYEGLIQRLVVDESDSTDVGSGGDVAICATNTRIKDPLNAEALARFIVSL